MTLHRPGHGDDTTGKRVLAKGALRRPLPGLHLGLLTPRLAWEAYGNSGILRDQPNPKDPSTWVWHAGHVTAVIDLGPADPRGVSLGDLLLAGQTGGVFRLTTDRNESRIVHAAPLSHGWDNPDVYALAHGPDGAGHFFAGCRDVHYVTDLVYESAPGSALPNDQSWRPVASVSDGLSWVHAMAVATLAGPPIADRRLVCATNAGIWYSQIPGPQETTRSYTWRAASWPSGVSPKSCTGLVVIGSRVIAAAADGSIWHGTFRRFFPDLTLEAAAMPALDHVTLASLAADADGARLYCLTGFTEDRVTYPSKHGSVRALLMSTDLGSSWKALAPTVTSVDGSSADPVSLIENLDVTGYQGGTWNNCVAVAPANPFAVVLGWQTGLFYSTDGGATFAKVSNRSYHPPPFQPQHLHEDVHALFFDPRDPKDQTLCIGSDGGLAHTDAVDAAFRGPAKHFSSHHNRELADLQFQSVPEREFYGSFSPSPVVAGLVAGGLQDNADVWRTSLGPWRQLDYGDGSGVTFCANGLLLYSALDNIKATTYQDGTVGEAADVPATNLDGSTLAGISPCLDPVLRPAFQRDGQKMYAVGGNGTASPNDLYGFFADDDGANPQWIQLGSLAAGLTSWSYASDGGNVVYIAGLKVTKDSSSIAHNTPSAHRLDTATGAVTSLPPLPTIVDGQPDDTDGAALTRLVLHHASGKTTLLAAYNTNSRGGQVLAWSEGDTAWQRVAGQQLLWPIQGIFGLETDDWGVCYAATDSQVWTASGPHGIWQLNSGGLPRRGHLSDIRFVRYPNGGVELFLSTFARGAWRARWSRPSGDHRFGGVTGGLAFNQLVGSLADGQLFTLGPHGLTPVGPIDPQLARQARDEFAALIVNADTLRSALASAQEAAAISATGGDVIDQWNALGNQLQRGMAALQTAALASGARTSPDIVARASADVATATGQLAILSAGGTTALVNAGVPIKIAEAVTSAAIAAAGRSQHLTSLTRQIAR